MGRRPLDVACSHDGQTHQRPPLCHADLSARPAGAACITSYLLAPSILSRQYEQGVRCPAVGFVLDAPTGSHGPWRQPPGLHPLADTVARSPVSTVVSDEQQKRLEITQKDMSLSLWCARGRGRGSAQLQSATVVARAHLGGEGTH